MRWRKRPFLRAFAPPPSPIGSCASATCGEGAWRFPFETARRPLLDILVKEFRATSWGGIGVPGQEKEGVRNDPGVPFVPPSRLGSCRPECLFCARGRPFFSFSSHQTAHCFEKGAFPADRALLPSTSPPRLDFPISFPLSTLRPPSGRLGRRPHLRRRMGHRRLIRQPRADMVGERARDLPRWFLGVDRDHR